MKKYVVFLYFRCYPQGGIGDIVNSFDDLNEAIKYADEDGSPYDFREVVDRDTWKIVWKKNKLIDDVES